MTSFLDIARTNGCILPDNYYVLNIYLTDSVPNQVVRKYNSMMIENNSIFNFNSSQYNKLHDAGIDLYCIKESYILNGTLSNKIDLGIQCSMLYVSKNTSTNQVTHEPCGYFLYPRSSTGTKTPLRLSNSIGVIDSGYRGNIIACFDNLDYSNKLHSQHYHVVNGSRLVQICSPNITYPTFINIVNSTNYLEIDAKR